MSAIEKTEHGARLGNLEIIWAKNSQDFFFANTLFLRGSKGILIDPSANLTYLEELAAAREVQMIINTHYHADHRALNGLFHSVSHLCHRLDAPAMRSANNFHQYIDQDKQSPYFLWVSEMLRSLKIEDVEVSRELEDGDHVNSGSEDIEVVHLPGHTPGHIGLYFSEQMLFYLSDLDLTPFGPWYAAPVSNIDEFQSSIQKARDFNVDDKTPEYYVSSHGERIYSREEFLLKLEKFEKHIGNRDNRILEKLSNKSNGSEGLTLHEIQQGSVIFRSSFRKNLLMEYFSNKMVEKHLDRLLARGAIMMNQFKGESRFSLT